ncbi:hypothetical protein MTER_23890 [Mycolicibacter terrae]|uniref:Uncharacterized protein n=1 Tax=Mycolicibacter terrae TaxID=1788 RepID=A0AAD1MGX9_9MYCO|nr:hypothetical protein MTER_23890 [Mycolicibacter terrae]
MMARQAIANGKRVPAVLAAATGIVAVGLLGTPVASGHGYEPGVSGGYQASACFINTKTGACEDVPDPTKYGCPPGDFKCMFDSMPPPSSGSDS